MAKKVFGAFYTVSEKRELNFDEIQAVSIDMRKCAKSELSVVYTKEKSEQGFFVGGHAEHNNNPEISMFKSACGVNIVVAQKDLRAEGLLMVTLALPEGYKLVGFRSEGTVIEYNLIDVDIERINLSNQKGKINFKGKSQNVGLYSKYYPVTACVELTGRALIQLGSRTADVNLTLKNASQVDIKRKPQLEQQCICTCKTCTNGYLAELYLDSNSDGKVVIQ